MRGEAPPFCDLQAEMTSKRVARKERLEAEKKKTKKKKTKKKKTAGGWSPRWNSRRKGGKNGLERCFGDILHGNLGWEERERSRGG